ncbi:uncharacterized protein C2845_PM01G35190 [Panicum miliaceum]|uniref:NAC domain-containing protein n=1 Tax=Panicum miliaceum TaxID=4540 RepID=A0A3L6THJ2_PANMI|nr:uncharacterized protein C2845_PM01G35190 [Panicum miliaceum]
MAAAVVRAPSDHDLIAFVLRPMAAAGQRGVGGGFVHMANVYAVAPEKLAERYAPAPGTGGTCWYFVCPARCRYRAAKAGALGEGGPDGRRVGQSRALSYGARTAAPWTAVTRHGWCMVELALDDQGGGGGDFVLCKLFRSPRHGGRAGARVQLQEEGGWRQPPGGSTLRAAATDAAFILNSADSYSKC